MHYNESDTIALTNIETMSESEALARDDNIFNFTITGKNTSDKDNYAYTEYEVTYQNKEKIKFSLYISKKPNITPTYIISIIN